MAVHSKEELSKRLSADLIWRKKEIKNLQQLIESGQTPDYQKKVLLRSTLPLVYAHWEGFIKYSGKLYVDYINMLGLDVGALRKEFRAMHLKGAINKKSSAQKVEILLELLSDIEQSSGAKIKLDAAEIVITKSNLNSERFNEICKRLSIIVHSIETREALIDEKMLALRNKVAHGEILMFDLDDFIEIWAKVLEIMEDFKTQIENAVYQKSYALNQS